MIYRLFFSFMVLLLFSSCASLNTQPYYPDFTKIDNMMLKAILVNYGVPSDKITILGRKYTLPTDDKVNSVVWKSHVSDITYRENFTCVHFSYTQLKYFLGMGYAFGCIEVKLSTGVDHMINIYINDKRRVVLLEPQTGFEYPFPESILEIFSVVII